MFLMRTFLLCAGLAGLAGTSLALDYQVNYTSTAPTIDGTVDAVWSNAEAAMTGFVSSSSVETPSTQQTRVRALWNSEKLFLLYEADDNAIVASATGNDTGFDFTTPQDAAEIILDPSWRQGGSGVTNIAYRICVNPAPNAYTRTEAGLNQTDWDLGPNSQVAFASSGSNWTVELAIAWTDLNSTLQNSPGPVVGPPGNGSRWGVQIARRHSPGNNASLTKWHPVAGNPTARPLGLFIFAGGPAAKPVEIPDMVPLYSTSFEEPEFTAGLTASGVEEWTSSNPGNFTVVDTEALTGTQSLEITPSSGGRTILSPTVPAPSGTHVIQYAVKMASDLSTANNYRHVLYASGRYSDGTTKTLTQIWFYGAGNNSGGNSIRVSTYPDPNSNTPTNYFFPGLYSLDDWSYITIRTDGLANTFEVWYNGTKLVYPGTTGAYPVLFRNQFWYMNRATLYNKTFGTAPFYLDDFTHYYIPGPTQADDWQLFE